MHHPQITLQKTVCLFGIIVFHALLPFTTQTPSSFWKLYAATQAVGGDYIATLLSFTLVPSFIFASGFLLEKSMQSGPAFSALLEKRIHRLLVPWFFVMLFWLVPLYTLVDIPAYNRPAGTSFGGALLAGLQGRFTDHLWFLLVLFWASLFWMICRPLLERAPEPALPATFTKPDLSPWLEKAREKAESLKPAWVNPEWFRLHWETPVVPARDLAGIGLAVVAAIVLRVGGKNLTWYCFSESAGPILFVYCGMLAYRHRDWLDTFLWKNFAKIFPLTAVPFLVLLPVGHGHFLLSWLLGVLGALLTYQLSLLLVRIGFPAKKTSGVYAFFERNTFRFYLFHVPTVLLVFMGLNTLDVLSPWLCILLTVVLTLLITAGVVLCSHKLEQTQLPKIAAGMRPGN